MGPNARRRHHDTCQAFTPSFFRYCRMYPQDKFACAHSRIGSTVLSVCQDIWFIAFERTKMVSRAPCSRRSPIRRWGSQNMSQPFILVAQRAKLHLPVLSILSAFDFGSRKILYSRMCGREAAAQGERDQPHVKYYTESNQEQLTLQLC